MDALIILTTLSFTVPAIPKGMMEKAVWYIEHQKTHIFATQLEEEDGYPLDGNGNKPVGFWFLRKDNPYGAKSISVKLIKMYQRACDGERDHRIKDLAELVDVCDSIHLVLPTLPEFPCPPCEGNPGQYVCSCKGCKAYGICSHVLAINHILTKYNVRYQLVSIGKRAAKTAGGAYKPPPALTRARPREPDSSDEEEERILELGRQGK